MTEWRVLLGELPQAVEEADMDLGTRATAAAKEDSGVEVDSVIVVVARRCRCYFVDCC